MSMSHLGARTIMVLTSSFLASATACKAVEHMREYKQ